jgi:hypothetical protein
MSSSDIFFFDKSRQFESIPAGCSNTCIGRMHHAARDQQCMSASPEPRSHPESEATSLVWF